MEQASRLDVQFPFDGTERVQPTLRALMPVLEARLSKAEQEQADAAEQADDLVNVGLRRINEVLLPSVERIQKLTSLGFLIAPSSTSVALSVSQKTFILDEGDQRDLFTPSAYVAIEATGDPDTRAVAHVLSYDATVGFLKVDILAVFGSDQPRSDWVISASPGVTEISRIFADRANASGTQAAAAALSASASADIATAAKASAVTSAQTATDKAAAAAASAGAAKTSADAAAASAQDAADKAPLASPVFTGTPKGPTPSLSDESTRLATMAALAAMRNAMISGGIYVRRRNRILDPGMRISQENGNSLLTLANGVAVYPSDGINAFRAGGTGGASVQRIQQTTPSGSPFRNRMTITAVNAAPASTDLLSLHTNIEGVDIADLKFGSANAKSVILCVGIRSSIAGNFALALRNIGSNGASRSYIGAISVAAGEINQDLVRFLTIPGDIAGTWASDNTGGFQVRLTLCSGSNFNAPAGVVWQNGNYLNISTNTNLMATNGATFDLFDVALYDATNLPNNVIPAFELDSIERDLVKCQRYFSTIVVNGRSYASVAGQNFDAHVAFPALMRVAPTASLMIAGGRTNIAANSPPVIVATGGQSARFNIVANSTGDFYALAETWALNSRI